ncbi:GNAT family N-acetyltransferase [Bacillus sp. Marseille-P3800]|uniref:GNAT family N-acetyltransferase n=1 Tax=Bacillus sp. Marseille-P3800 TaxID=2014782 RepID=UPI000C0866EB|nr:GNAT family N-acetyltransferase [Bacillus sp. Marseille-P3800]
MRSFTICEFSDTDFSSIQQLNHAEGWSYLTENSNQTQRAWSSSTIRFVAKEVKTHTVIGYVRGLTDGNLTTYICELLVAKPYQGHGVGDALISHVHSLYPHTRLDVLSLASSKSFYEKMTFRPLYGFRKTYDES